MSPSDAPLEAARAAGFTTSVDSAPDLKKALKKAVDAGLARTEAIKALTLNAAGIYGLADRLGSVEEGKIATLVVTKGEAFEDASTVEYVLIDGKRYVHAHCYRSDEILMLLRVADEMGFKIRTLQQLLEGYKVADEIVKHGAGASTFSDWWAYKIEAYDATP